jgi:hypothetical protein
MKDPVTIKVTTAIDIEGILKLQSENQESQGGNLSGELSPNQIKEMMDDMP